MATDKSANMLETAVDDDFLLDDIEDMPGFVTPPTGVYTVKLEKGIEEKEINDSPYYEVAMTIISVEEVNEKELEEGENLPKPGDIASCIYARSNKFGMGNFKEAIAKPIAEKFNCKTVGEVKEQSKGLELMVVIKRSYDKKKERHNINIKKAHVI